MTWAWIETSSAETGSSHTISLGLSASARAIPRRWRCPPLKKHAGSGSYTRDACPPPAAIRRPGLSGLAREAMVDHQRFTHDAFHRHTWIKRREGVLEDNLHVLAGRRASGCGLNFPGSTTLVGVIEPDFAAGRLHQAHDGAAGGRLSAAALTDQAQRLAFFYKQVHSVHSLYQCLRLS